MSREPAVMQAVPGTISKARAEQVFLAVVIASPLIALAIVVPAAWGHFLHWRDIIIGVVMYGITGHGVTVGYHRYFTHGAFKTNRFVKCALAIAGSMAIQGPVKRWVADHRRHHQFSDHEGDPHSPHVYGRGTWNMAKGIMHAHVGWLFDVEQTNQKRFIPDLLADRDLHIIDKLFAPLALLSLGLPALLGWVFSGFTLLGAATAFVWAGVVRVALLHHSTWAVNSICHTVGRRPFKSRDQSRNVWPLAILSMGESWHNLHHSDPTAARHGVLRGQIDSTAFVIKVLEKLRLAKDVRWPSADRIADHRVTA